MLARDEQNALPGTVGQAAVERPPADPARPQGPPPSPPSGEQAPPRVCLGRMVIVSNPVASINQLVPACGQPQRLHLDGLTQDPRAVTCPRCLEGKIEPHRPENSAALGQTSTWGIPPSSQGVPGVAAGYQPVLAGMDVSSLQEKKEWLQGELAAVEVLLQAAQAREKIKKDKP